MMYRIFRGKVTNRVRILPWSYPIFSIRHIRRNKDSGKVEFVPSTFDIMYYRHYNKWPKGV